MCDEALREVEGPAEVTGLLMHAGDQEKGECAGGEADEHRDCESLTHRVHFAPQL
jgi:hypothetical protein